jgi:anti-anti-sigma regulatory factor
MKAFPSMMHHSRLLRFACQRNTVLLTLAREFDDDAQETVEAETETVLRAVREPAAAVFLLDFEGQHRCRSRGLLMLLGVLWKHVRQGSGKLLICNPAPHDLSTLKRMRLDRVWPVYATREEALCALASDPQISGASS